MYIRVTYLRKISAMKKEEKINTKLMPDYNNSM